MITENNYNSHSELCPVCKGTGIYKTYVNNYNATFQQSTCHGCGGKGWIVIYEGGSQWKIESN